MHKITLETQPLLVPVPVALISLVGASGAANILAASWLNVACATPPMLSLAVRTERLSCRYLQETGEFVVNIPRADQLRAVDFCGVVSGRDVDKFRETGLTPLPSLKVRAPGIAECPAHIECVVRQALALGSHVLFVAEAVAVRADADVVEDGALIAGRVAPLAFDPYGGDYWTLKEVAAHHGFSEGRMPAPKPPRRRSKSDR